MPQGRRLVGRPPALPAAVDPAGRSVFDPWWQRLARTVSSLAGLDDPTTQILTPAVTTFPSKAARAVASTRSIAKLRQVLSGFGWAPEEVEQAVATAAKYPRVMAHVEDVAAIPGETRIGGVSKAGSVPGRSRVGVAPSAPPGERARTVIEELGHGAQRVSLKESFDPLYTAAHRTVGYVPNPLEVSGRAMAGRRTGQVVSAPARTAAGPRLAEVLGPDAVPATRAAIAAGSDPAEIAAGLERRARGRPAVQSHREISSLISQLRGGG